MMSVRERMRCHSSPRKSILPRPFSLPHSSPRAPHLITPVTHQRVGGRTLPWCCGEQISSTAMTVSSTPNPSAVAKAVMQIGSAAADLEASYMTALRMAKPITQTQTTRESHSASECCRWMAPNTTTERPTHNCSASAGRAKQRKKEKKNMARGTCCPEGH
jgi:hypothetical protein